MKNSKIQFKPESIAKRRWVAYAAAGAATALAGSQSAEAAIHYSGPVNERFLAGNAEGFRLDQPGDSFRLSQYKESYYYGYGHHHHHRHHGGGRTDGFQILGIDSAAFRGVQGYVSKLSPSQTISMGNFMQGGGYFAGAHRAQGWPRGTGFIGFRFDNGAGVQYGWARITTQRGPAKSFILVDYAYADPGERLRAGQTSEGILRDEQGPDEDSLGGLALGAVGLLAWRKSRKSLTARLEDA